MLPIIPHFANECLQVISTEKKMEWPKYNEKLTMDNKTLFVIQINGKKRGLVQTKEKITEDELFKKVLNDKNMLKYLDNKVVKRKIFVPNKLMNIIV